MTPPTALSDMSHGELCAWATGTLVLSIGNGDFRDQVEILVSTLLRIGYQRGKTGNPNFDGPRREPETRRCYWCSAVSPVSEMVHPGSNVSNPEALACADRAGCKGRADRIAAEFQKERDWNANPVLGGMTLEDAVRKLLRNAGEDESLADALFPQKHPVCLNCQHHPRCPGAQVAVPASETENDTAATIGPVQEALTAAPPAPAAPDNPPSPRSAPHGPSGSQRRPSSPAETLTCDGRAEDGRRHGVTITKGQHDVSLRALGKGLCPICARKERSRRNAKEPSPDQHPQEGQSENPSEQGPAGRDAIILANAQDRTNARAWVSLAREEEAISIEVMQTLMAELGESASGLTLNRASEIVKEIERVIAAVRDREEESG